MIHTIQKHAALELAILMNTNRDARLYLIGLLQRAYEGNHQLDIDVLESKLNAMAHNDSAERVIDVLHYILCLRLEAPVSRN